MEDNKSCIFNPMGGKRLPWGSYYGLIVKIHSKMVLKIRLHIMYVETGTPDIKVTFHTHATARRFHAFFA